MTRYLTLILALLASGLALPSVASAGGLRIGHYDIYVSGHHSCGCAIKTKRVFKGYDYYHRPIYRYYSVPVRHTCRSYSRSHYRSNSYRYRSHYDRRRYEQRRRHDRRYYRDHRSARR